MQATIVRYTLKADRIDENVAFVRAVFAELAARAPDGVHYATFQADDGVSFTHVALFDTDEARGALGQTDAFKAFTADIGDRCESPPNAITQELLGSYGVFG
ncbi:MAG: hypothetical protein OEO77_00085 [Acidimicrobiia bacterium]|nr:hypothetical protein [Acidimicrobiia bacterium]